MARNKGDGHPTSGSRGATGGIGFQRSVETASSSQPAGRGFQGRRGRARQGPLGQGGHRGRGGGQGYHQRHGRYRSRGEVASQQFDEFIPQPPIIGSQSQTGLLAQHSGIAMAESKRRQMGDASAGGHGGGPSSATISNSETPDLHQATLACIQPKPSAELAGSSSHAASSSQLPLLQMEQEIQKLSVQSEGASTQALVDPVPSGESVRFPLRPGKGKLGMKCMVKANHFLVQLSVKDLHQYRVSLKPEITSVSLNQAVMKELVKLYEHSHLGGLMPAFDGQHSLYTAGPLPFTSKEFEIILRNEDDESGGGSRRERKFKVLINFAACVDVHHLIKGKHGNVSQVVLQALYVVLRQTPMNKYTPLR